MAGGVLHDVLLRRRRRAFLYSIHVVSADQTHYGYLVCGAAAAGDKAFKAAIDEPMIRYLGGSFFFSPDDVQKYMKRNPLEIRRRHRLQQRIDDEHPFGQAHCTDLLLHREISNGDGPAENESAAKGETSAEATPPNTRQRPRRIMTSADQLTREIARFDTPVPAHFPLREES